MIDDAFGLMLEAVEAVGAVRGRIFEVVERSDGSLEVGDASRYFAPHTDWSAVEQQGISWAKGAVVDIGVGAGRHAIELLRRRHEVIGVDSSPRTAALARRRGVNVMVHTLGREPLPLPVPVDTALLMGNNLGLLADRSTCRTVLAELASVLGSTGRIVGSAMDPHRSPDDRSQGYMEANRRLGRLPGQYRLRVRFKESATPWFDYLFLSVDELEELLFRSPWRLRDVYEQGPFYAALLEQR